MGYEAILYDVAAGVATITLNRPDSLNALNRQITVELQDALASAAGDPAVRCLLITGAGRGFSAGADLSQLEGSYKAGTPAPLGDMLRDGYNKVIIPITKMEKPVVAAVNGVAAGAGSSLALACDFRIASDKARFFQAFIKIGLVQDSGASYFLPRLVGFAKAMELALLGDIIGADDALKFGLVTKVVPHDTLADEARAFAEKLASGPTRGYGLSKRAMYFGIDNDIEATMDFEADLQAQLALTADHMEGVKAFREKREAKFEGR